MKLLSLIEKKLGDDWAIVKGYELIVSVEKNTTDVEDYFLDPEVALLASQKKNWDGSNGKVVPVFLLVSQKQIEAFAARTIAFVVSEEQILLADEEEIKKTALAEIRNKLSDAEIGLLAKHPDILEIISLRLDKAD